MLPPGRAKLSTNFSATGSTCSHDDNGYRFGRLFGCADCRTTWDDNHIDLQLQEFCDECIETVRPSLRIAVLYLDILSVYVAELLQPFQKSVGRADRDW